jgi:N-acetylmuramoyl-L-alanine amidase
MSSAPKDPRSDLPLTGADADEKLLSRRAVIFAGAALFMAGCSGRASLDPMAGVSSAPTGGSSSYRQPGDNGGAPGMPIQPEPAPITGNGYTLVPRRMWTSQGIKGNNNPMGAVTRITVHHTGEHGSWDDIPDSEIVQRIERYHRDEKGWAAIGYHFLVGKDGKVYEGRPAKYQGAHTSTQNENNLGVSVIGDFMHKSPSPRQLSALKAFLDDKRGEYGVGKGRIYGHRDLHQSLCPGDALYAWVKQYKAGQA